MKWKSQPLTVKPWKLENQSFAVPRTDQTVHKWNPGGLES